MIPGNAMAFGKSAMGGTGMRVLITGAAGFLGASLARAELEEALRFLAPRMRWAA